MAILLLAVACGDDDDADPAPNAAATDQPAPETTENPAPTEPAAATNEPPAIQLTPVFSLSEFSGRPVDLAPIPGQEGRYLALDQVGVLVILDESAPNENSVAADLQDRVNAAGTEEGLLGLAISPDWQDGGDIYIYYTAADPRRGVLSRLSFDGESVDAANEQVLFEVEQPAPNHNGGALAFGPDGYLYLGLGDGGSGASANGQDGNHLGSILRFDVSGEELAVPPDNPFAGGEEGFEPETYAYGFRNPWRFSFDLESDELWVGDVGQATFEEVNLVEAGGNYGWSIMEGPECFEPEQGCDQTGLELPVAFYAHDEGCSITGGFVYRGSQIEGLNGWYLYSDYCSGRIWALRSDDPANVVVLLDSGLSVASFAQDSDGELFVLAFDGTIYRLEAA
ncbi:MAG TPA: PQQ-dependent sugar dehydrogenase [Dehalococcoidia bacterium]|nr:PQQ-dependent sugar dehydrogenase [Dehalococcoidia bacterium]